MEMMKARPPHLAFSRIAVENRQKSLDEKRPVFDNVDHVTITAIGSKDSVTKPALPWLEACDQQVREERLPAEWASKYRSAYEHWARGEEAPVNGIPIGMWEGASPAERASCKAIHILTVEDLAMANEEAKRRLGMGALDLVNRAKRYLDAASGPGALVAENKDLQEKYKASEARRVALEERVMALEAKFGAEVKTVVEAAKPGIEEKL